MANTSIDGAQHLLFDQFEGGTRANEGKPDILGKAGSGQVNGTVYAFGTS